MSDSLALAHRALLTWRSTWHLRPGQVVNRMWRKVWRPRPVCSPAPEWYPAARDWAEPPAARGEWQDECTVRIHAQCGAVRTTADWRRVFADQLRLYQLHYLDQLCATDQPGADFAARLLVRWIEDNPPGSRPGWDPYPISRRVVNALKAALSGMPLSSAVRASLADQCRYLVPRIERHLLGNHLLANAKALVFAGACFASAEGRAWLQRGFDLLRLEVHEQVLADGGHIERSPMYHALVTQDLLDLVNLRNAYALSGLEYLDATCERMLAWQASMSHPDGGIALINDSTQDGAFPLAALAAYARRLGLRAPAPPPAGLNLLRPSGFARLAVGPWCLLAEVGGVGPGYQPGHAHAGTLGYELSVGRERIVVDTGVSTYAAGARRAHERSTAAHNTVTLDGENSSEVWGAFRVARRARATALEGDGTALGAWVRAAHDGYRIAPQRARHARRWLMSSDALEINDTLTGRGAAAIRTAVHFHPGCRVDQAGPHLVSVMVRSGAQVHLRLDEALAWRLDSYLYAPNFGVQLPATVLSGDCAGILPQSIRLRFVLGAHAGP